MLLQFDQIPDSIQRCKHILDQSKSPYACALAASTLIKAISKMSCTLEVFERLQIRDYALEYLATRQSIPHFVVAELCKLICRIVKNGWFDVDAKEDYVMRDIVERVNQFIATGAPIHCILGVQLLQQLVTEMNQSGNDQRLTRHRKVMTSFRDKLLFGIFETSLSMLHQLKTEQITITDPAQQGQLAAGLLELAKAALSFDFLGTNSDESSDDTRTAQSHVAE